MWWQTLKERLRPVRPWGGRARSGLREAEHALADDVLHDLVGAAGEAGTGDAQHELSPRVGAPLAAVGDELGAEHVAEEALHALHVAGERQLAYRHLRTRQLARLHLVGRPLIGELRDTRVDIDVGHE